MSKFKSYYCLALLIFAVSTFSCKSTKKTEYSPNIAEVNADVNQTPSGQIPQMDETSDGASSDDDTSDRPSSRVNMRDDRAMAAQIDKTARILGLNAYQKEKFHMIHQTHMDEIRNVRGNSQASSAQGIKDKYAELKEQKETEIKNMLSEDQYVEYKRLEAQREDARGGWKKRNQDSRKRGEERAYERKKNMELDKERSRIKHERMKEAMNPAQEALNKEDEESDEEIDFQAKIDEMIEELELDEEQGEAFREIESEYADNYLNAKAKMESGDIRDMRSKLKAIEDEHTEALMELLSVEQYQLYEDIKLRISSKEE